MTSTQKPILLVLGSTGNVGRETIRFLTKQKNSEQFTIRAGVRDLDKGRKGFQNLPIELVHADLDKPETLDTAFRGISKVFLIPGLHKNRQLHVQNAVDAAKKVKVEHFLLLSLVGCDSRSTSFAKQFKECEDILEKSDLCWTVIRCVLFQETVLNFIEFEPSGTLNLAIMEGKFCPITLRDIAEVAATILLGRPSDHAYKTYNLTGPELLGGQEIAKIVSDLFEEEISFVSPSAREMAKFWSTSLGCDEWGCDGFNDLLNSIANNQMCLCSLDGENILARKATPISKTAKACKEFINQKKSRAKGLQKQKESTGQLHKEKEKEKEKGTEKEKGAEKEKEKEMEKAKIKMKRAPQEIRIWPK